MSTPLHVLIVEDSEDDSLLILRELRGGGYDPKWKRVETEGDLKAALGEGTWDVVISDFAMPAFNGLAALDCIKASGLDLPFLIVSGNIGEDLAADAMKAGACDYIMKDRLKRLVPAVTREVREAAERRERKAAQDEFEAHIRQTQKMEALGTLVGGIAHDFNNILTAIVVNSELARQGDASREDIDRYLTLVLGAAGRGRDLVRQVLSFSRKKDREPRPVRLAPVIREAVQFLRAALPATIAIEPEISAEEAVVLADPTEIHEVVINLGTNGAQAMRETGGTLTVRLAAVDVDEETAARCPELKPGPFIRLTVEDTGCGIAPDILPRIFDPFFTTKPQGEGTGMGLAVVHGIVASSGGAISVTSRVGRGTSFRVYFPRASEAVEPEQAAPGPIAKGHGRVLVVDDEETQAASLRVILERLGYEASFETDAVRALERFRAHPGDFDVVVTDQTMPRLVGSKLAEEILRIRPDIPIILCTGFSDDVSEETAGSLGIREFVMKPYTIREMAAAIRRALDSRPKPLKE
jgi:signal transduction histidine kinase